MSVIKIWLKLEYIFFATQLVRTIDTFTVFFYCPVCAVGYIIIKLYLIHPITVIIMFCYYLDGDLFVTP